MKFRGHAHRSLDDKGRLILPPDFRDLIRAEVSDAVIVLTIYDKHVIGITPEQWTRLEGELEKVKSPTGGFRTPSASCIQATRKFSWASRGA